MGETFIRVNSIHWSQDPRAGYDIHVIQGASSCRLAELLRINYSYTETGSTIEKSKDVPALAPPHGIKVQFIPLFITQSSTSNSQKCVETYNDRVTVEKNTGQVSVSSVGKLRNFLIRAEATDPAASGKPPFTTLIRVHIHQSIRAFWLTPSELTVRINAKPPRFTVLAQFDDETVGNISYHRNSNAESDFTWVSDPTNIIFFDSDGAILLSDDPADINKTVRITATLPPSLGGVKTASAQVRIKESWASLKISARRVSASLISGTIDPQKRSKMPNVLFLSEGFLAGEETKFSQVVRQIINAVHQQSVAYPFTILPGAFNYWEAFIASPQAGVSVLNPLFTKTDAATDGFALGEPLAPASNASTWTINELIYQVGLPVPADATSTLDDKVAQWSKLFVPSLQKQQVPQKVFDEWKSRSKYKYADELDTVFGIALGETQRAETRSSPVGISWHPLRTTREDINACLAQITDGDKTNQGTSPPIGQMWSDKNSRSYGLVVILCAGGRDAGSRSRGDIEILAMTATDQPSVTLDKKIVDSHDAWVLKPVPVPAGYTPTPMVYMTLAHECSHAFGLRDEYGNGSQFPEEDPTKRAEVAGAPNVQIRKELTDNAGNLVSGKIRWLWPRIAKAGVLLQPPLVQANRFLLTLEKKHALPFNNQELVRLRTGWLLPTPAKYALPQDTTKNPDEIVNPQTSVWLKIVDDSIKGADQLIVEVVPNGPQQDNGQNLISPSESVFQAGSILFFSVTGAAPTEPPEAQINKVYKLVAQSILNHLNGGCPLNAFSNNPTETCSKTLEQTRINLGKSRLSGYEPQLASNLPTNLKNKNWSPPLSSQIIGLYDGGNEYACGIYHPSGICLMRLFEQQTAALSFCHVCAYVLVDLIDPTQHSTIDAKYNQIYMQL
jgi:hypothetical protein